MNSMPFVRCVGIGRAIWQNGLKKAYDWRMLCILEGDGVLELEGERLQTGADQLYVIPPGTAFRVCASEDQTIAVVNFDSSSAYAHIAEPVLSVDSGAFEADRLLQSGPIPFLTDSIYEVTSAERTLFEELYQLYLRDDLDRELKSFLLSGELMHIFSRVLRNTKQAKPVPAAVYQYILERACDKLTLEQAALELNYSPSYIEKLLRKHYGTSFRQLVVDTRLKKALWLLENTSDSCAQIAAQLGFYSSQHFTQSFKKKYHRTPKQCR